MGNLVIYVTGCIISCIIEQIPFVTNTKTKSYQHSLKCIFNLTRKYLVYQFWELSGFLPVAVLII